MRVRSSRYCAHLGVIELDSIVSDDKVARFSPSLLQLFRVCAAPEYVRETRQRGWRPAQTVAASYAIDPGLAGRQGRLNSECVPIVPRHYRPMELNH